MENPGSKTANFRFSHAGLISKESPDLLKSGQYRSLRNVCSMQEGALSSRTGSKLIGSLGTGLSPCNVVRKLVVTPNKDPLVPSTNPRYLDIGQNQGKFEPNLLRRQMNRAAMEIKELLKY